MSAKNGSLPSEFTATIFSRLPAHFPESTEEGKVKTDEFLEASAGVVLLVEKFGKAFSPVTRDMNGNIKKITVVYEEDKKEHQYMEDMILKAKRGGELNVVEALQWLRRALHFISRFFQSVIDDTDNNINSQDLSPYIRSAYRQTLERYHGWLGVQTFNILSRFVPNRRNLLYTFALERHNKDEVVVRDMRVYTQRMSDCVVHLVEFYEEHELETNDRV